ncbi:MAG: symmetrical bis(5'-nucleosyl)-tetraphosphatase [Castellaniella sp.]
MSNGCASVPESATAPVWVIGDLQGCRCALERLLAHPEITADPRARFWFCGDLVNRGPDSLGTLKAVMALGERASCVLGNHDIHTLAVFAGHREPGKSDTLDALLSAPDAADCMDWLRHRPLAHYEQGHLMVHAGVLPQWTVARTLALAGELETALRAPDWQDTLADLFGNKPRRWREALRGTRRLRVIVNALTRLRMCTPDGRMDFKHKGKPVITAEYLPWFELENRATANDTIVFGHWSVLGLMMRPHLICLDTGCVWGRELTAMRLHDRHLVQVSCHPDNAAV